MIKKSYKVISAMVITTLLTATVVINQVDAAKSITKVSSTSNITNNSTPINMKQSTVSKEYLSASKEETVYVNTDASGQVKEVIVSDWLKNQESSDQLLDKSDLSNIENVKGDESYELNEENRLIWNSKGSDIYYQGTTDKSLPVDVTVTYILNDKVMTSDEITGKSGKVTIRFDYTNHEKKVVNINGNNEDIFVPFAMVTGLILPTDRFTNIEVKNGKNLSDGNNNVILGVAFPGLQESLNLKSVDSINIPSFLEITADVSDFSLDMTMTVAMSNILDDFKFNNIEDFNSLGDSLTKLTSASDKLVDGSSQLSEGLHELQDKGHILENGVTKLADGTAALAKGSSSLKDGTATLTDGIVKSKDGIDSLVNGYASDKGAVAGAKSIATGLSQVSTGISALSSGIGTMTTNLQDSIDQYTNQLIQLKSALAGAQANGRDLSKEQYQQIGQLEGTIAAIKNIQLQMIDSKLSDSVTTLKDATSKLSAGADGLYSGINSLYMGSKSLQTGLSALSSGSIKLKTGIDGIYTASVSLNKGALQLEDGTDKLMSGINKLTTGSDTLKDGAKKLDKEGIQKLSEVFDGDISNLLDRINAIVESGNEYQTFTDLAPDAKGSVKFVIKTE